MGPAAVAPVPRFGAARLAGIGVVVFLANAGLLVLQLLAGRLLAPFVGSSLETWTGIIGGFLAGIAVGNAAGGRLADRNPTGRALAAVLVLGAASALWVVGLPELLAATGAHRALPLGLRIPVLAVALCFPPGFVLSLPTPLAIRLGLPDVRHAGRVAGLVFALGTLGCLVGNYVTGFYLIPTLTVNAIALPTAGLLAVTAVGALAVGSPLTTVPSKTPSHPRTLTPSHLPLRRAYAVVFLCSFAAMTLELGAFRLMAQVLGVSLFTATGVIGVMLAGTACGNWLGGVLADRAAKSADPDQPGDRLGLCLAVASAAVVVILALYFGVRELEPKSEYEEVGDLAHLLFRVGPVVRVLAWSFLLFFAPMALLGMVSPQVIRLAVPDVAHAGRVAGRVYAWSTVGAIAGTFATGYGLVSTLGVYRTVLAAAALPAVAAAVAAPVWQRSHLLYTLSVAMGAVVGGLILLRGANTKITRETNYYTIKVVAEDYDAWGGRRYRTLVLDLLTHSIVDLNDPTFIHYKHEYVQVELLQVAAAAHPAEQRALVIGGGGYTFPRYARTTIPTATVDVVEIDPGVTAVAYEQLGLDPRLGIVTYNMDGRQFVAERAPAGHYHLVSLDAVNDLAVPSHLLTKEFNEGVKRTLTPDGVYLLTVIDMLEDGKLWRAAVHTLKQTFPHVEVLTAYQYYGPGGRQVYVIYAANQPLDLGALRRTAPPDEALGALAGPAAWAAQPYYTRRLPDGEEERLLAKAPPLILTDQFAPTDNLMAEVYRRREIR